MRFQFFFILFLTACFRKTEVATPLATLENPLPKITTTEALKAGPAAKEKLLSKPERESIYFSASLEKEALKLLLKDASFDDLTLFSVLSYAVETQSGIKKMAPARLDCSRFLLEQNPARQQEIKIYKTCQKPAVLLAVIDLGLTVQNPQGRHNLKVTFYIKEWAQVVGLSTLLTAKDPVCEITIEDKKLQRLSCENWSRSVSVLNTSAEEIRLKTFIFERKQKNQFVLKGGRYKDLTERVQFNIEVPLEGKIVRWEKEIEVIDEFADKLEAADKPGEKSAENSAPVPVKRLQINGEKNESEEIRNQQTSKEAPQENDQQNDQQDGQGSSQTESQNGQDDGTNGGIPPGPQPQQPSGGR